MLCAFLAYTGAGTKFMHIGQMFDMTKSMAGVCCKRVAAAIIRNFGDEIQLPTREEAQASAATYLARHDLPGCIGAIDGTHIPCK